MAGEGGGGKASSTFCLADHGTLAWFVWADSSKTSLELLIPNLGSAWPLSSLLSMQSDCKVIDDWQDFTVTSQSCN